jgi:hypothetical protein
MSTAGGRPNRFPLDCASRSAASPALSRHPEPNPAPGRNTHRWDGVVRSRMHLGLSTACPATPRPASAVTAYLSDRPNWPTFHSKQDCVPPPQAHPCPTSVPIVRSSNCVPVWC